MQEIIHGRPRSDQKDSTICLCMGSAAPIIDSRDGWHSAEVFVVSLTVQNKITSGCLQVRNLLWHIAMSDIVHDRLESERSSGNAMLAKYTLLVFNSSVSSGCEFRNGRGRYLGAGNGKSSDMIGVRLPARSKLIEIIARRNDN